MNRKYWIIPKVWCKKTIKKGDKFRCIKTLIYANSDLWYQKGKIYTSDMDGCITDEDGDIYHEWIGRRAEDMIEEYFIPYISNKRRGYGRCQKR